MRARIWLLALFVAACVHPKLPPVSFSPVPVGIPHTYYIVKDNITPNTLSAIRKGASEWTMVGCPMVETNDETADITIEVLDIWPYDLNPTALALTTPSNFIAFHSSAMVGYDYASVAAHEIGHALGLDHSEDRKNLMYPGFSMGEERFPTIVDAEVCH